MSANARHALAYLMWCFSEGYLTPEDRAVGTGNWMLLPDDQLHPDDIATRDGLLSMADEILAVFADAEVADLTEIAKALLYKGEHERSFGGGNYTSGRRCRHCRNLLNEWGGPVGHAEDCTLVRARAKFATLRPET